MFGKRCAVDAWIVGLHTATHFAASALFERGFAHCRTAAMSHTTVHPQGAADTPSIPIPVGESPTDFLMKQPPAATVGAAGVQAAEARGIHAMLASSWTSVSDVVRGKLRGIWHDMNASSSAQQAKVELKFALQRLAALFPHDAKQTDKVEQLRVDNPEAEAVLGEIELAYANARIPAKIGRAANKGQLDLEIARVASLGETNTMETDKIGMAMKMDLSAYEFARKMIVVIRDGFWQVMNFILQKG
jgi:hypothetical protein